MTWNTHPESDTITKGTLVKLIRFFEKGAAAPSPAAGDVLNVEYPNITHSSGRIVSASQGTIQVEIENKTTTWKLVGELPEPSQISLDYVVL